MMTLDTARPLQPRDRVRINEWHDGRSWFIGFATVLAVVDSDLAECCDYCRVQFRDGSVKEVWVRRDLRVDEVVPR